MVKINVATATAPAAGSERALAQFVQRGNLLPVISGQAIEDLVFGLPTAKQPGGRDRLAAAYAKYVKYPMPDANKLHKVAKYRGLTTGWKDRKVKEEYLDQVAGFVLDSAKADATVDEERRNEVLAQAEGLTVSEFAIKLGYPRFQQGVDDPLLILANLPVEMYLTTSPFTFLEEALRQAGKRPRSEVCPWRPELRVEGSIFDAGGGSSVYEPTKDDPLVFHLFGMDTQPESLVLTEDDHLDFLAAVSQGRGKDQGVDPVHDVVKGALQKSALLLLGFSLASWTFRALYRGLIRPMPSATLYERYCCVQAVPDAKEQDYLQDYLKKDARFDEVYWQPVDEFCRRELRP